MIVILHPQRRDDELKLSVEGETLFINGETFDLSPIPDDGRLPRSAVGSDWIADDIERFDGQLRVPIFLPLGKAPSMEAITPKPLEILHDGTVELPR